MRHKRLRMGQRSGALLLEVLLAIVIMSVSLGVIIQALTTSLRAARFATQYTQAVMAADNQMAKTIRATRFSDVGESELGHSAEEGVYEFSVENSTSLDFSDLEVVSLVVRWDTNQKTKSLELATYMRNVE